MQKASEGESTVGGPAATSDMSPEVLYPLDPAHGLCMPEGNSEGRVNGEWPSQSRGRSSARARQYVVKVTSETLRFLVGV